MGALGVLNLLATALRAHLNKPLTPEVAARIFAAVAHGSQELLDTSRIGVREHGGYTYRCERLHRVLEEIRPLHLAHWAERCALRQESTAPHFDYPKAIETETRGGVLLCTVRHDGDLVGSVMAYLYRSMHDRELHCVEDSMYVRPEHRSGRVGYLLFDYFEDAMIELGVDEARFETDAENSVNKLLARRGYACSRNVHTKRFDHVQQRTAA